MSRTLNKTETNYSTIEKELLAIVWACKTFRHYIYGRQIKILSDHKPLIWLDHHKDNHSRLFRWKTQLSEYNYVINYKKGSQNKVADFLSRIKEQNIEVNANEIEISTCGTYHTSIENTQPYIVLQDIPVNKFKTQIIITKTDNNNASSEINRQTIK